MRAAVRGVRPRITRALVGSLALVVAGCGGSRSAEPGSASVPSASASAPAPRPAAGAAPGLVVRFLEPGTQKLEPMVCGRAAVVAAAGEATAGGVALAAGDILFVTHPQALTVEVQATSTVVLAVQTFACDVLARPAEARRLVRASEARELRWAGGAMSAHLDVGKELSPDLYLGRLAGSAAVAEHVHEGSNETLVALEAAGTFTIDGKEHRLGPKQIVFVPRGTKHSWKPDAGSKLVAVQLYDPPGPEQRFVALARAEESR